MARKVCIKCIGSHVSASNQVFGLSLGYLVVRGIAISIEVSIGGK